jgi:YD repeat-containing protein
MSKMCIKHLVYTASALLAVIASGSLCRAQYYYKDIVVTGQISANYRLLRTSHVSAVHVNPSADAESPSKQGITVEQTVNPSRNMVVTHTNSAEAGESWLTAWYNEKGQLINTVDSTLDVVTSSAYTYDAAGRLASVSSNSVPKNYPSETEKHTWSYNAAGMPVRMVKVKNDNDTSFVSFEPDEKGNPGEEKVVRNRVSLGSTFYYFDDKDRLTDVARYNKKADRILPEYMFEYNDANQLTQMIIVPEGTNEYMTWKYAYNPSGLRQQDACYNKLKQLMGKVDYSYDTGR